MLQLKLNMEKEGVHMSKRETYEARTEELITPILERMHFELVDVEYVKRRRNLVSESLHRQGGRDHRQRLRGSGERDE